MGSDMGMRVALVDGSCNRTAGLTAITAQMMSPPPNGQAEPLINNASITVIVRQASTGGKFVISHLRPSILNTVALAQQSSRPLLSYAWVHTT